MQEFSSVTASSYDAESLAPLLNEKAADGWSVVSIVAAGTNIVAYLQREAGGATAAETPAAETPAVETPVEAVTAAVDEPAGWASAPDEAADAAADAPAADVAAQVSEPEPEPQPAAAEPVVTEAAAAAESTVPAGWYADPSGRFELRYWDGTAWTEHVSRAGQQFTDPPVA